MLIFDIKVLEFSSFPYKCLLLIDSFIFLISLQQSQIQFQTVGWNLDGTNLILVYLVKDHPNSWWRPGIESVVCESAYHVIGLKTLSLWVTLTSIPGLQSRIMKNTNQCFYTSHQKIKDDLKYLPCNREQKKITLSIIL